MRYVALLRGISPMNAPSTKLRAMFKSLELLNVQTILSSGNVVFECDVSDIAILERRIEKALLSELGIKNVAMVRSADQVKRLVDSHPFGNRVHSPESYLTVTFLKSEPSKMPEINQKLNSSQQIISYDAAINALFAINNTTLRKTPDFMTKLEKEYGKYITTRTWNTILKINTMLQG